MRILSIVLFLWIAITGYSQSRSLIGIYQANWDGPSYRYLLLDCDSTYHIITHWDFGAQKDVEPDSAEKKKWSVQGQTKAVLEVPIYGIKSFDIQSDGKLIHKVKRQSNTWVKIASYNRDCVVDTYHPIPSDSSYVLIKFSSHHVILTLERFNNDTLTERITYHALTEEEINGFARSLGRQSGLDPVMELKARISIYETFWPPEKIEKWDNGLLTTSYFNKDWTLIRKE